MAQTNKIKFKEMKTAEQNTIFFNDYGFIRKYAGNNAREILMFSVFKYLQKKGFSEHYIDAKMLSHRFSMKEIQKCFKKFK